MRIAAQRAAARGPALWCGLMWMLSMVPASAQILSVMVQGPDRDFGHFTGDLMTATAVIASASGTTLDARSLPVPGPADGATDVRAVSVAQSTQGARIVTTIGVTYQTFAAPEHVSAIDVPGYSVTFLQGTMRLPVRVPGFRFTASPFRNDVQPVLDASVLRPDPAWPRADARPSVQVLVAGASLLVAGITLLLLDRGRRAWPGSRKPFAAAARAIARLPPNDATPNANLRDALLILHRAFDATAGRSVLAEDLPRFFAEYPRFAVVRAETEAVFALSRSHFFAAGDAGDAPALQAIARLAQALVRVERRA